MGCWTCDRKEIHRNGHRDHWGLTKTPTNVLKSILGNQAGMFKKLSLGIDNRPIESRRTAKSIGDESTYETDMTDENEINRQIALHSDVVAQRLRKQKLAGRTISLKIRFASFRTVTRSITLEVGTDLQEDIYEAAMKLKEKIYFTEGVRLIGITASIYAHRWKRLIYFPINGKSNLEQKE